MPCMKPLHLWFLTLLLVSLFSFSCHGFSFSDYEAQEQAQQYGSQQQGRSEIDELLQQPCVKKLRNQTAAFVLMQEHHGVYSMSNSVQDSAIYACINGLLQRLGLNAMTPQQIRERIADAEQQAFLANDMDAAASAASRLGARFLIKAQVITSTRKNPVVGIDEISVTLIFALSDANGKTLARTQVAETVFSDVNVHATLLKLVEQQGEAAVAGLYQEFCRQG